MASSENKNITNKLESFFEELKIYQAYLTVHTAKGLKDDEYSEMMKLREKLVREASKFRKLITELTDKDTETIHEFGKPRSVDIWAMGLRQEFDYRTAETLSACVDTTNSAIGKLQDDIKKGVRDEQGNLIEKPQRTGVPEIYPTYENYGGKISGDAFEIIVHGTVDMTIECMMRFTKKLNSQGHSYKSNPRIGGHPDYAKPDRTCSATVTIAKITEGKEKQISTIELQLIPDEKTLFKTSHPKEWDSSFKYFLDALFAEFEQLGYVKKQKADTVEGLPQEAPVVKSNWKDIEREFGVTKMGFGRKINFITDPFKRTIIFRDVEQAFVLASSGFSKPAVILAGSVIEELLRLYLEHKQIKPIKNDFDGYIQTCEQHRLLKGSVSRLTHSVRQFRNLVHLSAEKTKKHTISKATAKGAVSSIFTIANDF